MSPGLAGAAAASPSAMAKLTRNAGIRAEPRRRGVLIAVRASRSHRAAGRAAPCGEQRLRVIHREPGGARRRQHIADRASCIWLPVLSRNSRLANKRLQDLRDIAVGLLNRAASRSTSADGGWSATKYCASSKAMWRAVAGWRREQIERRLAFGFATRRRCPGRGSACRRCRGAPRSKTEAAALRRQRVGRARPPAGQMRASATTSSWV